MHEIVILYADGCSGAKEAKRIADSLAATRTDVSVREVLIESEADAVRRGFRGSPTVLVDGDDVEIEPALPPGSMG